jgi:integral membrane protein (TIGR00529 family)
MTDILKIIIVFIIIIILLKKRWNLGLVMALSSVILAALYMLKPQDFLAALLSAFTSKTTITLIIALTLIRIFENIMRTKNIMKNMMDSFRGIVTDRRILMASMPALIGLLPSMGGALFSAPMVDETSRGIKITPEKKAFINYVFRHPWEFISPLYPGLILASAITMISLRDLILFNLPYAFCLISGGIVWGLRGIVVQKQGFKRIPANGLLSFIPLLLILVAVILFRLDLSISIAIVIIGLFIFLRYSLKDMIQTLREGFSVEIVIIILGVMSFKAVMDTSGAVENISAFVSQSGVPVLAVFFIIPFLTGLLTGLTVGFVGSTFPIIAGLDNAQDISAISFAFASGYVGVLLSPVHLCLVLTREYFKADMADIYKMLIRTCIVILLAALAWYCYISY